MIMTLVVAILLGPSSALPADQAIKYEDQPTRDTLFGPEPQPATIELEENEDGDGDAADAERLGADAGDPWGGFANWWYQ